MSEAESGATGDDSSTAEDIAARLPSLRSKRPPLRGAVSRVRRVHEAALLLGVLPGARLGREAQ